MRGNKKEVWNRSRVAFEWEDHRVEGYSSCTNDSYGNYSACNRMPRQSDLSRRRSFLDREVPRTNSIGWSSTWKWIVGCIPRRVESAVSSRRFSRSFDPLRSSRNGSDARNRIPSVRWNLEDRHHTSRSKDDPHRCWDISRTDWTAFLAYNRENDAVRSGPSMNASFASISVDVGDLFGSASLDASTPGLSAGLVADASTLFVE